MSSFPPREHSHRLTESAHYCIDHEFEDARLRRIDGTDVKIGDFYGEPNAAIIDKDERWCAVGGCGLIVYRLREPFEAYDDDRQSVQWEEFYRSPPEIWWIGSMEQIDAEIVKPTVDGLVKDGLPYRGFIYFGLMITEAGPKIIEYNCRFGDPECQAVMPIVGGDLAAFCYEGAKGNLKSELLAFSEGWSVCLVRASAGYPESARAGDVISGIENVENARVYHAGTKKNAQGNWETNGGRVLAVVAGADDRLSAVEAAYAELEKVTFDGMQSRTDIGVFNF